jgi:hypothetical protein
VRPDPQTLLRGLAKFVAVVVAAGLVGAGVGIALAKLSGNDGSDTPAIPAAASTANPQTSTTADSASPTRETPPRPSTAATETTQSSAATTRSPSVRVLSALLGRRSYSTGRALVAVRIRVKNRAGRPLVVDGPVLLSGQDEIRTNASPTAAATALTRPVAPGASATGTLRFILPPDIAQRLHAKPAARLRIAKRTVALTLKKG